MILSSGNGSTNLGDEAMWEAAAVVTQRTIPTAEVITDASSGWSPPMRGVECLPFFPLALRRGASLLGPGAAARGTTLERLISRPQRKSHARRAASGDLDQSVLPARRDLARLWRQRLAESRALVISGAGAVCDEYVEHGVYSWGLLTRWANELQIPIAMLGQGIGPLSRPEDRQLVSAMLRRTQTLTVRDPDSLRLAKELGATHAQLSNDWAILNEPSQADRIHAQEIAYREVGDAQFVAFTLHLSGHSSSDTRARISQVLQSLVAECRRDGLALLHVPTMTRGRRSDDRLAIRLFARGLGTPERAYLKLIDEPLSSRVTRALLGLSAGVVTTRYHASVFALAEGIPTIGLAHSPYYAQKLGGLAALFSLDEGAVKILYGVEPFRTSVVTDLLRSHPAELDRSQLEAISGPYVEFLGGL